MRLDAAAKEKGWRLQGRRHSEVLGAGQCGNSSVGLRIWGETRIAAAKVSLDSAIDLVASLAESI